MFAYLPLKDSHGFGDNWDGSRLGDFRSADRLVLLYNQRMAFILANQIRLRQVPCLLWAHPANQGKEYHISEITLALLEQFPHLFISKPFGPGWLVGQPWIADDTIFTLLMPYDPGIEHAEERRVFYVALTRAKKWFI